MSNFMGRIGILKGLELSGEEYDQLLKVLHYNYPNLQVGFLDEVLQDEQKLIKYLDVFSGDRVVVPNRDMVNRLARYIRIYNYCKRRDFNDRSIKDAAKIFSLQQATIKGAITKISVAMSVEYSPSNYLSDIVEDLGVELYCPECDRLVDLNSSVVENGYLEDLRTMASYQCHCGRELEIVVETSTDVMIRGKK